MLHLARRGLMVWRYWPSKMATSLKNGIAKKLLFSVVLTFLSAGPLAPVLRKVSPVKGRKRHWTQLYWEMLKPTMKLKQRKWSPEDTSSAKHHPQRMQFQAIELPEYEAIFSRNRKNFPVTSRFLRSQRLPLPHVYSSVCVLIQWHTHF